MNYIVVRTYGNGKHMNSVYPIYFEWLSQAEAMCAKLNGLDSTTNRADKWIIMPVVKYTGEVW